MELNNIDAPPPAETFSPPYSNQVGPQPTLQRQTSVKFTNMQRSGSVRQIGQYRPELVRPHNMTTQQAAAVEARRRQEATQTRVEGIASPLSDESNHA